MFYITELTKQKNKTWLWVLLAIGIIAAVCTLIWFIGYKTALSRAIAKLDVNDEQTVISVMKYASKNPKIITDVAKQYSAAKKYDKAALLCMYVLEYLEPESDTYTVFEDAIVKGGGQKSYAEQFKNLQATMQEFEVITQNEQGGYGIADGIYTEFLGGYAKAKICAAIPVSIYAADGGAYFLDSTDGLVKFISQDGSKILIKGKERASELIYFGGKIYYISQSGVAYKDGVQVCAKGEICANLKISAQRVICTVYTSDYDSIKDITIG